MAVPCAVAAGADAAAAAAAARTILGRGWDMATADFWTFEQVYAATFFADTTPDSCFVENPCRHVSSSEHEAFSSVAEWGSYYSNSFGVHGSGTKNGFTASVGASVGAHSTSNWTDDKSSWFFRVYNRRMCYQMKSECVNNVANLHANVKAVLAGLPNGNHDAATLDLWVSSFINRFGSHLNVASEHGAEIKVLTSSERQCQIDSKCLQHTTCAGLSFVGVADVNACPNGTHCDTQDSCQDMTTMNCVLTGGDKTTVATNLCSRTASEDSIAAFLNSGDLTQGSSAYRYQFQQISEVLLFMGYSEASAMLEKATEYHSCVAPRLQWVQDANGAYGCTCALRCENGAVLDTDSCTCKCQGDAFHGFKGSTCAAVYGHCQPGPGNGNAPAGDECRRSNHCKSWYDDKVCSADQVCCMSDVNGKCCPYGSSCSCPFLGNDCSCETRADVVV